MPDSATGGTAPRSVYTRLLGYLLHDGYFLLFCIGGYLLYSVGTVLLADLLQYLLDAVSGAEPLDGGILSSAVYRFYASPAQPALELARVVIPLAVVVITGARAVGYFAGNYGIHVISRSLVHRLRCDLFHALLMQPAELLDGHSQGELVAKVTYNVEQIAGAVSDAVKTLLRESFILIALLGYMAFLNWRLCLVFVAVTPVITFVVGNVGQRFKRYSARIQDSMGEVTQVTNENVHGYRDIRMFNAQAGQHRRFSAASGANRLQSLKMARVESLSTPFLQVVVSLAFAALIWFALSPAVLAGFSAGSLVAFLTAASQLGKPVRQLSAVQGILQRGVVAAQDVFEQIDRPREADEGELSAEGILGRFELQGVTFTYPGATEPALCDISLTIEAGETLALVGRSGSGKSTLLQLLVRLYTPQAGKIKLDGQPLAAYSLDSLRRHIAVVAQRVPLFRETIYNNVALGVLGEAPSSAVQRALTLAHADAFVNQLPEGVHTQLGDGGAGLSGGEQQRLALARAILKDAPVLILDEATSALDTESEFAVAQALQTVMQDRTSIVIAHRPATIERADRIVLLDAGRVAAVGTHAQLLATSSLYAKLYQREFLQ